MTSKRNLCVAKWLVSGALVLVGSSAMADWSFNTSTNVTSTTGILSTNSGGITATATGLSTTGNTGTTFANATSITSYAGGGLGVQANTADVDTPQHSTDNSGFTDAILLSFNSSVVLTGIKSGWTWKDGAATGTAAANSDSDVSVLRYIGTDISATAVAAATLGKTVKELTAVGAGWTLVSQLANLVSNAALPTSTGDTTLGSSWWLISAYNSDYRSVATTTSSAANLLDNGNDYFKLLAVAGVATPRGSVPEPGSLALVGAGLLGFLASRRKTKGKSFGLAA